MAVQTVSHSASTRNRITAGAVLLVFGILMFLLFTPGTEPGQTAKFGMNLTNSAALKIPDIIVPVQTSLYVLSFVVVFLGAFQMARGVRSTGALLAIFVFAFVAAFLIWATKGKSLSLIGMLSSSLVRATPIALAALCGVISERAAVVNIGIEGIMLISAQAAVVTATISGSMTLGLIVGVLAGALLFSMVNSLQLWIQVLGIPVPSDIAVMMPYVLTILVLVATVSKVRTPSALTKPFERED
ncbi:MAG: hypothetical protein HGA82_01765 [Anaerolineales bacterium]|nr:hypothetical protein [Anaerolineales bacterium]